MAWLSFLAAEHEFVVSWHGVRAGVIPRKESLAQQLVEAGVPVAMNNPTSGLPIDQGAEVAYYAGFPLITESGYVLGGLSVADTGPHTLSLVQQGALTALARKAVQVLELNRGLLDSRAELEARKSEGEQLAQAVDKLQDVTIAKDMRAAELAERNAELQTMAETDGLTGLRNYRSFNQHMRNLYATADPVAVLLIDVDWFKNFNDAYGHVTGDETLRTVGALIELEATSGILAFRYGGEEFALVIPSAEPKSALQVGEQLRQRVERHSWPDRPITICVGVAVRTGDVQTVEDLVQRADDALYAAKRTGKNRVLAWAQR